MNHILQERKLTGSRRVDGVSFLRVSGGGISASAIFCLFVDDLFVACVCCPVLHIAFLFVLRVLRLDSWWIIVMWRIGFQVYLLVA
jgi:hypothetical protein